MHLVDWYMSDFNSAVHNVAEEWTTTAAPTMETTAGTATTG